MRFIENIKITKENQDDFANISVVFGYIDIQKGVNFTASFLTKVECVYIQEEAIFTAPLLEEIVGFVDIQKGAIFATPVLRRIKGYVYIQEKALFNAALLSAIFGSIIICENATFAALSLQKCGSVNLCLGATYITPVLTEVLDDIYIEDEATFIAPVLDKVKGVIIVQKRATLNATNLVDFFLKVGYDILKGCSAIAEGKFPNGIYLNLTEREKEYLKMLNPLVNTNRVSLSLWEQSDNWKKVKTNQIRKECSIYSVSEWLHIFELNENEGITLEEIGKTVAPNLDFFIYESNENIKKAIDTFLCFDKNNMKNSLEKVALYKGKLNYLI
ncbi:MULTISPECIES: hypothetical protein [unclassified Flavobacterium]|uniref:hypothetical protein n=1 Tax=unclassified Flavobacterium TaxID=196869 RepID=UPI00057DA8BE|nr:MULTISPECIES: hypothetical protein [unclassified Flavobacterium]KIA92685.1 hypothetical protein OA93_23065 [Flavobacterium sp. KMS]OUL59851.1 hypothetical protein B8T70_23425 [Flavobacterium sp. AJR]